MLRNLYLDIASLERLKIGGSSLVPEDAQEFERIVDASSRRVDSHCRRGFYVRTATRVFPGNGECGIWIPDLIAATSIKLDEDGDRAFELTLNAATDYYLTRRHYEDEDALPKTWLELDGVNGQRSSFVARRRLVEIAGRWGYCEDLERLTATGTLADAATADLALNDDKDGVCVGQTLLLGTEQVYVKGGKGKAMQVARGVNGTEAAAHTGGTALVNSGPGITAVATTIPYDTGVALPTSGEITIESERIIYTGGGGAASGTLTGCTRGAYGTTAATHADNAPITVVYPIDRYVYPSKIVGATFAIASKFWKRKDTSYASNVTANPVSGTMEIMRGKLDPDVEDLLFEFVRGDSLR